MILNSMGTSDIDQVSKIGKLGLIDGNLVIIATKFSFLWPSFSTIFWKYMIQTSYQKFVQSKLVFHYNSFLCKRRCLYLQKSSDSEMFCDQKKLGRYHDQVSVFWKNGHDNDQVIFNLVVIFWDRSTISCTVRYFFKVKIWQMKIHLDHVFFMHFKKNLVIIAETWSS